MRVRKKTRTVAFSGIISALCVVFLYLGSIIEVLDYSAAALCGILVTLVIVEFGNSAGIGVWLCSSFIGFLFKPQSVLLFALFCGWYSLVKKVFERRRPFISYLMKFSLFNAVLAVLVFITLKVFFAEQVSVPMILAAAVLANVVFAIYDLLLTRIIYLYVHFWRKRLTFLK